MNLKIVIFLLFSIVASLFADEKWTRTHYFAVGAGVAITQGDLEGEKKIVAADDSFTEQIFLPNLGVYPIPEIEFGANLNQHTIFVMGSYTNPTTNFSKKEAKYAGETDTKIFLLGLGYNYNFFWNEPFQVALGASYSFQYLSTESNAYFEENKTLKSEDAAFMGNGFAVQTSLIYFISRHVSMNGRLRFRAMYYSHVFTDNISGGVSGTWQFFEEVVLHIAFHF